MNIYLKFYPENQFSKFIEQFNNFLAKNKLLQEYQITPYLAHYPLHVTLYLTEYPSKHVPKLMKQMRQISKKHAPLSLTTMEFIANPHGYLMLAVNNTPAIRKLSTAIVTAVAPLRDKNALIPTWAAGDPQRKRLFQQYGSPNVASYFTPHVSVFLAEHLTQKAQQQLQQRVQVLIAQFGQQHNAEVTAVAYAVGVGIADAQGQIIREIGAFPLS